MNEKKFNNCTPATPMPADRDQMGQHWYHHGAKALPGQPEMKPGDSQTWECPNCKHQFIVTLGTKPVSVADAQRRSAELRARGVRFPR
jgi:hypothetical protein